MPDDRTPQEIAAQLIANGVRPHAVRTLLSNAEQLAEDVRPTVEFVYKEPYQPLVQRMAKGTLVALPAGIAGALAKTVSLLPPPEGSTPAEYEKWRTNAVATAQQVKRQLPELAKRGEARRAESLPIRTAHGLADVLTGPAQMATDLLTSNRPSIADTAKQAFQTGQAAVPAAAAQLTHQIQNPLEDPVQTALLAAPLVGAGLSGMTGAALKGAELAQTAQMPKVAKALELAGSIQHPVQGVAGIVAREMKLPGVAETADRLKRLVDSGLMTPAKAAEVLKAATPIQEVAAHFNIPTTATNKALDVAARLGKGAAWGGLLTGEPVGAAVGAALSGAGQAAGKAFPLAAANLKRVFVDPMAQPTEAETARMVQMQEPAAQMRAAMPVTANEIAEQYKQRKVAFHPDVVHPDEAVRFAAEAPQPAGFKDVAKVAPTGEVVPQNVEWRAVLADHVQNIEHENPILRKVAATMRTVGDVNDPRWQNLDHVIRGIADKYHWVTANVPELADAQYRAKMQSVFKSLSDAVAARDKYTVANSLHELADAGEQTIAAMRKGRVWGPDLEGNAALESAQVQAGLQTNQAQRYDAAAQTALESERRANAYEQGIAKEQIVQNKLRERLADAKVRERQAAVSGNLDAQHVAQQDVADIMAELEAGAQLTKARETRAGTTQKRLELTEWRGDKLQDELQQAQTAKEALVDQRNDLGQRIGREATNARLGPARDVAEAEAEALKSSTEMQQTLGRIPQDKAPRGIAAATDLQRGVDIAAGVKAPFGETRVPVKTSNPHVESMIDRLQQIGNEYRPAGEQIPREWYARVVTDVMRTDGQNGLSLLQSPRGRGLVVEQLAKDMRLNASQARAFRTTMGEQIAEIQKNLMGPVENGTKGLVLQLPDGTTRDLAEVVGTVMADTSPEMRAAFQQEALQRIGQTLGVQAADAHQVSEINRELQMFHTPIGAGQPAKHVTSVDYARNLLDHYERGGHVPLVMPVFGKDAAATNAVVNDLRSMAAKLPPDASKSVEQLVGRIEQQVAPTGNLAAWLDKQGIRGVTVSPGFQATMNAQLAGRAIAEASIPLWDAIKTGNLEQIGRGLQRRAKIGPTALSIPSAAHNFASNAMLVSMFDGQTPIGAAMTAAKDSLDYAKHLRSGGTTADDMMWRSLGRTGLPHSSLFEGDVGNVVGQHRALRRDWRSAFEAGARGMETMDQAARNLYTATGDAMWKVSQFRQQFQAKAAQLKALSPGKYLTLELPHSEGIRVVKLPTGDFEALGKVYQQGTQELADLIGKSAATVPEQLFFHNERQPIAVQWLRNAPVIGVAAPFVTWPLNAIDTPFKQGLGSRVLMNGLKLAESNDPAIHFDNARKFALMAARRAGINAVMQSNVNPAMDPVRSALARNPANPAMAYKVGRGGDTADVWDASAADYTAPTEMLLYGGHKLWQAMGGTFPDYDALMAEGPEAEQRLNAWARLQSGKEFTADNALELAGLSGSPLYHLLEDDRPFAQKSARFLGGLMGGTPSKAIEFGLDPHSINPSMADPGPEHADERFFKMIFDVGMRPVLATGDKGRAQRQIDKLKSGITAAVVTEANRDRERLLHELAGRPLSMYPELAERITAIDKRVAKAKDLINKAKYIWTRDFNQAWEARGGSKQQYEEPEAPEEPQQTEEPQQETTP